MTATRTSPGRAAYGIAPEILAPVREHIRDDVQSGHASLFRHVALDTAPAALPLETAVSALTSARAIFQATRLWQRDMYEHYQLRRRVARRSQPSSRRPAW